MGDYRILWIEENDINKESRRIRVRNEDDESDELLLELKPHAQKMASGVLLDDDFNAIIPPRSYVLTEKTEKTLEQWREDDYVMIYLKG